jgi:hypothetical protein
MRQSQVGHFDVPDSPGGFGNNKPKGVVRGPVGQTVGQRTIAGGEPWKEMVRYKADQIRLPVHNKGPNIRDINWLFAAPRLKRIQCSMWKSIIESWMRVG